MCLSGILPCPHPFLGCGRTDPTHVCQPRRFLREPCGLGVLSLGDEETHLCISLAERPLRLMLESWVYMPNMQNMLFLNVCNCVIVQTYKNVFALFGALWMSSGRGVPAVALPGALGPHAAPGSGVLATPLSLLSVCPLGPPPGRPPGDCGLTLTLCRVFR